MPLTTHSLDRVLIVDWDVHHGNGTQDVFYKDPRCCSSASIVSVWVSIPAAATPTKPERARGWVTRGMRPPLRHAAPDYRAAFRNALDKAADKIKPQLVLVSAGFDAHARDPIGALGLEVEDFAWLTQQVLDVAQTHSGGRLVSCLEGGYNLDVLAESVQTIWRNCWQ